MLTEGDVSPVRIRAYQPDDWSAVWRILEPIFRAGETYGLPRDITEKAAQDLWTRKPEAAFVAVRSDPDDVVGTYFLRPNGQGPASHVCNCGYAVSQQSRGLGVASAMCEHSQREGLGRGYRSMQFNLVVASNAGAVRLWQKLGFAIVGTLPQAFAHPSLGLVDAHVMFKHLDQGDGSDQGG